MDYSSKAGSLEQSEQLGKEIREFKGLSSLVLEYQHKLYYNECYKTLIQTLNGLDKLEKVEVRIPSEYKKDEQEGHWATQLHIKPTITYI